MKITESELPMACAYLKKQFAAHTWWPKEQPGQALQEFTLMQGSAASLTVWCEKWLDAGQMRLLEKAIKR